MLGAERSLHILEDSPKLEAMKFGIKVLAIAGLIWGMIGLLAAPISPAWLVIPVIITAAILIASSRTAFAISQSDNESVQALTKRWTIADSMGITLAVIILFTLHRPAAIGPAAAIIIGLHFYHLLQPTRLDDERRIWGGATRSLNVCKWVFVTVCATALPIRRNPKLS